MAQIWVLLWLWCRSAAMALIRPLAWELPYAAGAALKKKKKKKKNIYTYNWVTLLYSRNWPNIVNQLYFNFIKTVFFLNRQRQFPFQLCIRFSALHDNKTPRRRKNSIWHMEPYFTNYVFFSYILMSPKSRHNWWYLTIVICFFQAPTTPAAWNNL